MPCFRRFLCRENAFGAEKGPRAPRSAPPAPIQRVRLEDQNEYVADTCGNGLAAMVLLLLIVPLNGLFQKFGFSVASNASEPSFTPAPMLNVNECSFSVCVCVGLP